MRPPHVPSTAGALAPAPPRAPAAPRSGLEVAGLALVALFAFVMVGVPIAVGLRNVWRAVASTRWPTVDGVVVDAVEEASVERHDGPDGRVRETRMTAGRVTVRYRVGGATHATETLRF